MNKNDRSQTYYQLLYLFILFHSFLYWRYFRSVIVVRKIYGYASSKVAYSKNMESVIKRPRL